ncbi:hypothetical protein F2P56_012537 [Juglans regia]|uniref:RBR-type E3 ubiquitin transferase n=2 Tax=Juglans regia TaxID=51240 RepID=A0A2I4DM90_JUGRE|nr:probable E3 ubiquitin-protein ligase ARI7 [Juglans regia]KAF5468382.1 hypothetical protein F2P56_012537 [Juglans regia]
MDENDLNSDHVNSDTTVDDDDADCYYDFFIKGDDPMDPEDAKSHQGSGQKYTILNQADMRKRQEDVIAEVSTVLSVSGATATILLRHFNWSVGNVHEAWFADEDDVRKRVGLLDYDKQLSDVNAGDRASCGICFDVYPRDRIFSVGCGHPFCRECWGGYIRSAINNGPGCLTLRCPDPSCSAAADRDVIDMLALSDDDKKKYSQYLLRSYVEENKKIKWCPGPDCEYAVEFDGGGGGEDSWDVSCLCYYSFCWNCLEDSHRPVDCQTVSSWLSKNTDESETKIWILARTKPCPRCQKSIEKNGGCMHMTCNPPCRYEFCWICLGDWYNHGTCNRYNEAADVEADKNREDAEKYVTKYTHYYDRWAANHSSRQKAIADMQRVQSMQIRRLIETQGKAGYELLFITDAWEQIIGCRQVLKWTYAYGYYLPENEHTKRRLFEFLQGEAEKGLERLHECAELELNQFLVDYGRPSEGFREFEVKLKGLTMVTRKYFEKLVRALENGLSEVQVSGSEEIGQNIPMTSAEG